MGREGLSRSTEVDMAEQHKKRSIRNGLYGRSEIPLILLATANVTFTVFDLHHKEGQKLSLNILKIIRTRER